jgi:hypothetical protein
VKRTWPLIRDWSTWLKNQTGLARKKKRCALLCSPYRFLKTFGVLWTDYSTWAHFYNMYKEIVTCLIFIPLLFLYGRNYFMYNRIIGYMNIECCSWKLTGSFMSVRDNWKHLHVRPTWVQIAFHALDTSTTSGYTPHKNYNLRVCTQKVYCNNLEAHSATPFQPPKFKSFSCDIGRSRLSVTRSL